MTGLTEILLDPIVLSAARRTLLWSACALIPSFLIAQLLASRLRGRGIGFLRPLIILPGMFYAFLVLLLLRPFPPEFRFSGASVVLAWILCGVPYLTLVLSEGIRDLDPRQGEAMRSLGAGGFRLWLNRDFIPTLPVQAAAVLHQVWLYFTSFSIVVMLGGGPPNETIEVAVYSALQLDRVDFTRAGALAFWQVIFLVTLRILLQRIPRARVLGIEWGSRSRQKHPRSGLAILTFFLLLASLFLLLEEPGMWWKPLLNSLLLGVLAAIGAVGLALSVRSLGVPTIAETGAWMSPILLALSVYWASRGGFRDLPALVLIQAVLYAPWVARSLFPILDRARRTELEAARILGATPLKAWFSVEWPRLGPPLLRIGGMIGAFSVMEVSTVMCFSRAGFDTLSSFIQNLFLRFRIGEATLGFAILLVLAYAFLWMSEGGDP